MIEKKRFEIGKFYEHTSGKQLHICGLVDTLLWGICFIAEAGWSRSKKPPKEFEKYGVGEDCRLEGVNILEGAIENWYEISEWIFKDSNFSK